MALTFEQYKELRKKYSADQIARISQPEPMKAPGADAIGGLGASLVREVTRPFARAGATLAKPIIGGAKLAMGDVAGAEEALSDKPFQTNFYGELKPVGTKEGFDVEKAIDLMGVGAEIASTIAGGFGVKEIARQSMGGFIKASAKAGAKSGALFGGLGSGGRALQEEQPSALNVGVKTAIGTGLGAVGGAVLGAVFALPKGMSYTQKEAEKKLADAYAKVLNPTQSQIKLQARTGKDPMMFLARENVPIGVKNGKLDTEEAVGLLELKYKYEAKAFDDVMDDTFEFVSLDKFANNLKRSIGDIGQNRNKVMSYIDNEISAYKDQFARVGIKGGDGDFMIPVALMNKIKRYLWEHTNFTTSEEKLFADLNYKAGHIAKEIIEEKITDANIKSMNSRLGDFATTINFLKQRNGAVVPGGRMGKYFARTIGAVAGSQGGAPGAIAGAWTGDKLAEFLQNPNVTTYAARRILEKLKKEGQETVVQEAEKILVQRAVERASRMALPQATTIPLGQAIRQSGITVTKAKPLPGGSARIPKGKPGGGKFFKAWGQQ